MSICCEPSLQKSRRQYPPRQSSETETHGLLESGRCYLWTGHFFAPLAESGTSKSTAQTARITSQHLGRRLGQFRPTATLQSDASCKGRRVPLPSDLHFCSSRWPCQKASSLVSKEKSTSSSHYNSTLSRGSFLSLPWLFCSSCRDWSSHGTRGAVL